MPSAATVIAAAVRHAVVQRAGPAQHVVHMEEAPDALACRIPEAQSFVLVAGRVVMKAAAKPARSPRGTKITLPPTAPRVVPRCVRDDDGKPRAIASSTGSPKPSCSDGRTKTSAAA